jgi:hypothetical protein
MDSFWQSALEAAEKAKAVAKSVSQKGIVSDLCLRYTSAKIKLFFDNQINLAVHHHVVGFPSLSLLSVGIC